MKLLKAFVRSSRVDAVVHALEAAGAPGITISRVHGVGYGYEPLLFTLSPSEFKRTLPVSKVEVVCAEAAVDRLIEVLAEAARTGSQGDGIVFVTPVERAVKVRTGKEGSAALRSKGGEE